MMFLHAENLYAYTIKKTEAEQQRLTTGVVDTVKERSVNASEIERVPFHSFADQSLAGKNKSVTANTDHMPVFYRRELGGKAGSFGAHMSWTSYVETPSRCKFLD